MNHLNTSNPEQLIYENELLVTTVLGGIKIKGLDRLRVTLKVEIKGTSIPAVRHNLDLYNDNQLEKFIRKTAGKLEIGTSVIAASLSELTENLEAYRLEKMEETTPEHHKPKPLTKQEQKEAEAFLKQDHLLERTNELIGESGVIGEEINRLLMFIIFTSRKTEKPLHVISLGGSGTGKTHLQEKVGELIPEEDRIEITTLSENAFYYFGQRELKHKLILIEDLDGADGVLYPLRELQSKKRISKTVAHKNTKGETRTINLVVEGPVSVGGCTTKESIYEDNANRSFLLYLDESADQDKKIMDYQRRASAGKINEQNEKAAQQLLKNCQRILQPVKVINPYAESLALPKEVFKPRRTNNHYLQFIEAVTFYHQFQRAQKADEQTGEVFIETTIADIKAANQLLGATLLRKSDTITGACRNHFEKLKLYLIGQKQKQFTNREISQQLRLGLTTVKDHHKQLFEAGYLKYEKDKKTRTHYYEVISYKEYETLQGHIKSILNEAVKDLEHVNSQEKVADHRPNGRKVAGSKNRPSNTKKTRKKDTPDG